MDKVPSLANRISLFTSKPQISRYAAGSITDYCHALYKAVCYLGKLPEEFTQEEVDGYLKLLPDRQTLEANCPRNVTNNKGNCPRNVTSLLKISVFVA